MADPQFRPLPGFPEGYSPVPGIDRPRRISKEQPYTEPQRGEASRWDINQNWTDSVSGLTPEALRNKFFNQYMWSEMSGLPMPGRQRQLTQQELDEYNVKGELYNWLTGKPEVPIPQDYDPLNVYWQSRPDVSGGKKALNLSLIHI